MTIPAPAGVVLADDWHGSDLRTIFGPTESVGICIRGGGIEVHASAIQHSDGRIDTELHRPQVTLHMRGLPSMDVAMARQLASALIEAADLCDRWVTDSR